MTITGPAQWEELVVCALLGAARRDPPAPAGPYRGLAGRGREGTLLGLAAAVSVTRDAGRRPLPAPHPPPPPCPPDRTPLVSAEAASRLRDLLAGGHPLLLREWLALAGAAGRRAPEELLPALLDTGHLGALAVLGERGRWLAARNPRWSWVTELENPEAAWPAAGPAARRRLLTHLRSRDPQRAGALLSASWQRLPPGERAALVPLLADGLSPADEPLLERARRDRRIGVRASAAELLSRLPGSRFAGEAGAAAAAFVRVEGGSLAVSLPENPADIAPVPAPRPPRGRGRGPWLLRQVVAHSPLRVWAAAGLSPRSATALAGRSAQAGALLAAWASAAVRQRDPAWARALLDAGAGGPQLLAVLPAREAAARVVAHLAAAGLTAESLALAEAAGGQWPDTLSRAVLTALPATGLPHGAQATIAMRVRPGLSGEVAASVPAIRYATLIGLLAARREMRREIT